MNPLGRIPGYDKKYIITTTGCVLGGRWKCRILSTQKTNSGYELVHLTVNGKRKAHTMHRLVAMSFIPNPKNFPLVNHKDGNKWNNHVNNLEWVTHSQNLSHAYDTGLMSHKGSKNSLAKLTESDIPVIRQLIKDGLMMKDIAKRYNVHYSVITCVRTGKTWSHVPN